jgi:hypothetical protein
MHATRSADVRFVLRRDPSLIEYALAKKRLLAGLGQGAGLARRASNRILRCGGRASAVAYVVLTVSPAGWTLEEAGDRDPAGARLGAILQVLLAREPSRAGTTDPRVVAAGDARTAAECAWRTEFRRATSSCCGRLPMSESPHGRRRSFTGDRLFRPLTALQLRLGFEPSRSLAQRARRPPIR